jgi:hypothetical protein
MSTDMIKRKSAAPKASPQEAYEIGVEAYVFLYPLIVMDITRRQFISSRGPMNVFQHSPDYPDISSRLSVRVNLDMLDSNAWLDLTREPVILSLGDTGGRYYSIPMLDMWTNVFAAPGWRTSGTSEQNYAIVQPGWQGILPSGVDTIQSPTPYVWLRGHVQCDGPSDYIQVHNIQKSIKITPLSRWGKETGVAGTKSDPSIDLLTPPNEQANKMPAVEYFKYAAELLKLHRPQNTDWSTIARMKRIGIEPGQSFDFEKLDSDVRKSLEKASSDGLKMLITRMPSLTYVVNGWSMITDILGVYGNAYIKRAAVAIAGLGTNQALDVINLVNVADHDGKPLDGDNKYLLTFPEGKTPPVNAFWSLTMYDAEGFPAANPINRFSIRIRDSLSLNILGSLEIYIQHDSPGITRESNWLPAPKGPLSLVMRLYAPKLEVLDRTWVPPTVKRAW